MPPPSSVPVFPEDGARPGMPTDGGPPPMRHEKFGRACRCGHGRSLHQHYRGGSDCSLCGCGRYRGRLALPFGLGRRGR